MPDTELRSLRPLETRRSDVGRQELRMNEVEPRTDARYNSRMALTKSLAPVVEHVECERSGNAAGSREAVARLAGARNASDAALVAYLAEVLEDGSWENWQMSISHWVRWQFGVTRSRAAQSLTLAKRWAELPYLAEVFSEGRLSFEQSYLVARRCPTDYEHDMVHYAIVATLDQLGYALREYHFDSDPPEEREQRDRASIRYGDDGRARLSANVDTDTAKRIEAAIEQGVARLQAAAPEDAEGQPTPRPSMIDGLLDCLEAASEADESAGRRRQHRPMLHIELSQLASLDDDLVLAGRWHLGPMLPSEWAAIGAMCDADIQTLVTENGRPLALGRTVHTVPTWMRPIIIDRDGGCQCCGSTRWLEVHHIVHWIDGGLTDPSNLITLCRGCHQRHHRGDISVSGDPTRPHDPHAIVITNRDGVSMRRTPPPVPPDRSMVGHYKHPLGEKQRRDDLWFNKNLSSSPPTRHGGDPTLN